MSWKLWQIVSTNQAFEVATERLCELGISASGLPCEVGAAVPLLTGEDTPPAADKSRRLVN